jgi:hypothetical protein
MAPNARVCRTILALGRLPEGFQLRPFPHVVDHALA